MGGKEKRMGKPRKRDHLEDLEVRWEDNIKVDLQELKYGGFDWIDLAQERDSWWGI